MPSATDFPPFNRLTLLYKNYSKTLSLSGGHKQMALTVAWNMDGRKLASGGQDKNICIWSMGKNSITPSVDLKGHQDSVTQVIWDPVHSEKVMSCSIDKSVRLWDIRSSKQASATIKTEGENINACWSPDGKALAVGNKDDVITFIDPRGGGDSKSEKTYITNLHRVDNIVNGISWNYAGDLFFMTMGDGSVNILEYPSLNLALNLQAHTSSCSNIAFDPRGRRFATGGGDAMTCIWDIDTVLCLNAPSRLDFSIRSLTFSHDGELIASGSEDPKIDIAHVETGELVHSVKTAGGVQAIAFHPSKHILAYCVEESGRNVGNLVILDTSSSSSQRK